MSICQNCQIVTDIAQIKPEEASLCQSIIQTESLTSGKQEVLVQNDFFRVQMHQRGGGGGGFIKYRIESPAHFLGSKKKDALYISPRF